jgi:hypothetical protein
MTRSLPAIALGARERLERRHKLLELVRQAPDIVRTGDALCRDRGQTPN